MNDPAPMTPEEARSRELLEVLKDTSGDRTSALEALLDLKEGWWGKMPLMKHAKAYALRTTQKTLFAGLSVDQIDWEGIADMAVIILGQSAFRINGDAGAWFSGVIRNLVSEEIREYGLLTASELPPEIDGVAPTLDDEPSADDMSPVPEVETDQVQEAIETLSHSLRITATPWLVDRKTSREIRELLVIKAALLRKRRERIAKGLLKTLSPEKAARAIKLLKPIKATIRSGPRA